MAHKVLVIEDDLEINELLGEYLGLESIGYVSALDGKSGIEKAGTEQPDAVILDLMLPDIDGYEICRQLSSHRKTAAIPVVILTCLNQSCDREKGISSGAFRFMNKPFLPDELLHRLKDAFEWRRTLTQRPPCGQIAISTDDRVRAYHGINDMVAEVFARSDLPEANAGNIREGFGLLSDWALKWGETNKRNPHLLVTYRLTVAAPAGAGGEAGASSNGAVSRVVGPGEKADTIEWTISEPEPAMLAEWLFRPQSMAPFTIVPGNGTTQQPVQPSPLAAWYQFLAKVGITNFQKDTRLHQIQLQRSLHAPTETPMPTVTIDGTRMPTRLRSEAKGRRGASQGGQGMPGGQAGPSGQGEQAKQGGQEEKEGKAGPGAK